MDILRSITPANPLNRTWGQNLGSAFKLALGSMAVASVLDVTGIYENNFGILKNVVDPIGEAQITSYGCPSISHLSSSEKISAMIDSRLELFNTQDFLRSIEHLPQLFFLPCKKYLQS